MPGAGFEPATNGLQNRCSTTELTRRLDERSGSYTYPALERSRNRWTADLVPLACAAVSGSANARSVPRKPGMSTSTGLRHMVYLGRCLHTAETFAGADNARGRLARNMAAAIAPIAIDRISSSKRPSAAYCAAPCGGGGGSGRFRSSGGSQSFCMTAFANSGSR